MSTEPRESLVTFQVIRVYTVSIEHGPDENPEEILRQKYQNDREKLIEACSLVDVTLDYIEVE